MEKEFLKFPSINQFHNRVKQGHRKSYHPMVFCIKPKLHGTNAAIIASKEGVYAQSRKRVLEPTKEGDNHGFAKWVEGCESIVNPESLRVGMMKVVGEWCGGSIQKGPDAICQLDRKVFAVFGVVGYHSPDNVVFYGDEASIDYVLSEEFKAREDVWIIPTIDKIVLSFSDDALIGNALNVLKKYVAKMEERDDIVCNKFGVEGPGEGVVMSPAHIDYETWAELTVKAKTAAHSGNSGNKKRLQKQTPISENAVKFAEDFATETRFNQAVQELGIEFDRKNTGQFLKWVMTDVHKESQDELEASGLDWKECSGVVARRSRDWFMTQCAGGYEV